MYASLGDSEFAQVFVLQESLCLAVLSSHLLSYWKPAGVVLRIEERKCFIAFNFSDLQWFSLPGLQIHKFFLAFLFSASSEAWKGRNALSHMGEVLVKSLLLKSKLLLGQMCKEDYFSPPLLDSGQGLSFIRTLLGRVPGGKNHKTVLLLLSRFSCVQLCATP